jgi:hypothetical protein
MKQEPAEGVKCRDKFLVQSVAVDKNEFSNVNLIASFSFPTRPLLSLIDTSGNMWTASISRQSRKLKFESYFYQRLVLHLP